MCLHLKCRLSYCNKKTLLKEIKILIKLLPNVGKQTTHLFTKCQTSVSNGFAVVLFILMNLLISTFYIQWLHCVTQTLVHASTCKRTVVWDIRLKYISFKPTRSEHRQKMLEVYSCSSDACG